MKPGIFYDISYLKDFKKEQDFIFFFGENRFCDTVLLTKKIGKFKEEIILTKNGNQIGKVVFECFEIKHKNIKIFILKIYSPLAIRNSSSLPLALQMSKKITYNFVNDFIFYSSKSLMNFECLVDLPIVYDGLTNVNSTRFEYIGNLSQIIPLQHKKNNKINLFLLIE